MKKDSEQQEHGYTPPTLEELTFDTENNAKERVDSLLRKQREGVKLGIRPSMPRGNHFSESNWNRFDKEVWKPWLEENPLKGTKRVGVFRTNPNQRESTRQTTLRRDRVTFPSDLEE